MISVSFEEYRQAFLDLVNGQPDAYRAICSPDCRYLTLSKSSFGSQERDLESHIESCMNIHPESVEVELIDRGVDYQIKKVVWIGQFVSLYYQKFEDGKMVSETYCRGPLS